VLEIIVKYSAPSVGIVPEHPILYSHLAGNFLHIFETDSLLALWTSSIITHEKSLK